MNVKVKKLNPEAKLPVYMTNGAAACDLFCVASATIAPGEMVYFKTGLAFEIPSGFYMSISPRSSFCFKMHLDMPNSPAVIDEDYRGEVLIAFRNNGSEEVTIDAGERIAQAAFLAYNKAEFQEVEELSDTERGSGGFGSTGKF